MILLAYFKARDAESLRARAGYALLFALSAFFGAQLRFTTVIAAIACLIAALFEKRVKLTAILAVPLALCFALGGAAIQAENEKHLGAENIRNNKLPVLHFVLMGLPVQSDEGYGQYGDGGWLIFTTSFDSPQARDAALRQKFIDRAYTLAHHPDMLLSSLSRKNLSTFGRGTFELNEIFEADAARARTTPSSRSCSLRGVGTGRTRIWRRRCFWRRCCWPAWPARRRCTGATRSAAPLFLTLLGAFLFLCIWETRARYFFQFMMVLLCAGAMFNSKRAD